MALHVLIPGHKLTVHHTQDEIDRSRYMRGRNVQSALYRQRSRVIALSSLECQVAIITPRSFRLKASVNYLMFLRYLRLIRKVKNAPDMNQDYLWEFLNIASLKNYTRKFPAKLSQLFIYNEKYMSKIVLAVHI